ncbi:DUF2807 domain-containing protein [Pedobacter changchengzhani]|uniref:DUF2807 domain-containing protein n=1 Tax=Pedobacter changchengzhani TaxID=2529274 RepID=A0A4R5MIM9_9SPHI|nr:head GIN domain-containing protein [Pedobacter changchengzhani]TDG35411.1 DUF2807 domain-containing protein [Pedobacter changchengzhani]
MKKTIGILFAVLLLATSVNLKAKSYTENNFVKVANDERTVDEFNGIAATGPITVVVTIGDKQGCRLEGDAEAIATIITEVKGNILIIRPQTSVMSWSKKYEDKKVTIYVSATELASLTMSGSGSMVVNGKVTTGSLTANLSGSGSLKLNADVDDLSCVMSGSGSVNIAGTATTANILLSSSGAFKGNNLTSENVTAKISGSGTITIKANKSLGALISGSGHVNYSGNATVEQTVIGSGRVRKI